MTGNSTALAQPLRLRQISFDVFIYLELSTANAEDLMTSRSHALSRMEMQLERIALVPPTAEQVSRSKPRYGLSPPGRLRDRDLRQSLQPSAL